MKKINKGYKLRIYPNKKQSELINKTIGSSRFVYNYFLEMKIKNYNENKITSSYFDDSKFLSELKNEEIFIWLKEVDKFSLQNSLKDLNSAYDNFFREIKKGNSKQGFPKFKNKKKSKQNYKTSYSNKNIEIKENKIKLPKLGWIKFRDKRTFNNISKINNVTVSKSKSGKYFVSISVEENLVEKETTGCIIGIDLGIKEFLISSDNLIISNPKYLLQSEEKLKKLQREYSRKKNGSNNKEKARIKLAKLHEKIANQRKYFLHELSSKLIDENQVICLETLQVKNMVKNHKLSKSISDASWGEFVRQLEYKGLWNNRDIIKINTFYPSSQLCSNCGNKSNQTKDLSVRVYKCNECGIEIDRDLNASINILNEGLRILNS